MDALVNKVALIPKIGQVAKSALEEVRYIRSVADAPLQKALEPVLHALKTISLEMEKKIFLQQNAILDAAHVHSRGTLPEAAAETLMNTVLPRAKWLSPGSGNWAQADPALARLDVDDAVQRGWPELTEGNIKSFHL